MSQPPLPSVATIYICHPPVGGRMWLVRQAGRPDARFDSEAKAQEHSIKMVAFAAVKGETIEVRVEGSDGAWRLLPLDGSATPPRGRA